MVYDANKVALSSALWCNGSMPGWGAGGSSFESSMHNLNSTVCSWLRPELSCYIVKTKKEL